VTWSLFYITWFHSCYYSAIANSMQFLCSRVHIPAGWRLETWLSLFNQNLLYNHFTLTTQKTQTLYHWEGLFTGLLRINGSYSIVACVFVAAGICLPNRCLTRKRLFWLYYSGFRASCHNTFLNLISQYRNILYRIFCVILNDNSECCMNTGTCPISLFRVPNFENRGIRESKNQILRMGKSVHKGWSSGTMDTEVQILILEKCEYKEPRSPGIKDGEGRTIAQAVSRRLPTAAARV
jgi:hypothetical protein